MSKTRNISWQSRTVVAPQENMLRSRRNFLKGMALGAAALVTAQVRFVMPAHAAEANGNKVLILYFSRSGNTRQLAEQIHERVGGDMIELKTAAPYPQDYDTLLDVAKKEYEGDARPPITTEIPHLEQYRTVFIGFPIWWGTMPMPFFTLLETYNMEDRNVIPFCTHGGSRLGRSERDIKKLCPQAQVLKGLDVRGSQVSGAQKDVEAWLAGLGLPSEN